MKVSANKLQFTLGQTFYEAACQKQHRPCRSAGAELHFTVSSSVVTITRGFVSFQCIVHFNVAIAWESENRKLYPARLQLCSVFALQTKQPNSYFLNWNFSDFTDSLNVENICVR